MLEFGLAGAAVPVLVSLAVLPVLTRRRRLAAGAAGLTVLGALALMLGVAAETWFAAVVGAPIAVTGLIWCLATVAGDPGLRWWHPVGVLCAAVATGIGIGWPFYGWSAGTPDGYDTAARIALAVAMGGAAACAAVTLAARLRGPRPAQPDAEHLLTDVEAQNWRG
jgi:glucose dehydrogenase